MKKIYLAVLCLVFVSLQIAAETILEGKAAFDRIYGTQLIRYKDGISNPTFIRFVDQMGPSLSSLPSWISNTFRLDNGFGMEQLAEEEDAPGWTHVKFIQTYMGIPIEYAILKAHVKDNRLVSISGYTIHSIPESLHSLEADQSLNFALAAVPAETYKWEVPEEEAYIKEVSGNPGASFYPSGKQVFLPENADFTSPHLLPCWKFDIYAHEPLYRSTVYVNAVNGSIVFENSRIHTSDSNGIANTSFSGQRSIVADYYNSAFRLRESGRGQGVQTFDMNNGTSYGSSSDLTNPTNSWPDTLRLRYATDAHWGAEVTYDYYLNVHNRNSIDNNGFRLRSYVHYGTNYSNAFWDGQRMTFGDGSSSSKPFTSLDIVGHEISHGLTEFTAGLNYSNEPGALNESFSDIFGSAIEVYGKPDPVKNWQIGEDRGSYLRSMSNPKARTDPDTYFGSYWYTGTGDNGGVHTNSGVQNHWFYLLAIGGSGTNDNLKSYSVSGLGIAKAEKITFRSLTIYLSPTSDYEDACFYAIQAAIDLYGTCSPELASVVNAWYAVGLLDIPYSNNVVSDFTTYQSASCDLPATVYFINLSNFNATSFNWDFGDSGSGTSKNAIHVYNAAGSYTVKLTASGGNCGSATTTKPNFITVTPPADIQVSDVVTCDGDGALINANTPNTAYWYTSMTSTEPIFVGTPFISDPLFQDTVFYAENGIPSVSQHVGPANNSFGGGAYFNLNQYLVFDVYKEMILESVKVYANGSKFRFIELRDNKGQLINVKQVYVDDGEQVMSLNFSIFPGTDYQLGITSGTNPDLFRNNSGASYPYTVNGLVSITRSSASTNPTGYYYFFYDWVVKSKFCSGKRFPVNVTIDYDANCIPYYSSVFENGPSMNVEVFPNPSNGLFNLVIGLKEEQLIDIDVIDINGRTVLSVEHANIQSGGHRYVIDGSALNKGLYSVRMMTADGTYLKKIILK